MIVAPIIGVLSGICRGESVDSVGEIAKLNASGSFADNSIGSGNSAMGAKNSGNTSPFVCGDNSPIGCISVDSVGVVSSRTDFGAIAEVEIGGDELTCDGNSAFNCTAGSNSSRTSGTGVVESDGCEFKLACTRVDISGVVSGSAVAGVEIEGVGAKLSVTSEKKFSSIFCSSGGSPGSVAVESAGAF